jgi:hypothetical protein
MKTTLDLPDNLLIAAKALNCAKVPQKSRKGLRSTRLGMALGRIHPNALDNALLPDRTPIWSPAFPGWSQDRRSITGNPGITL